MDKEERQLCMHFKDLAEKSYRQNIYTFSDFLGLSDQDIFHGMERELAYAGVKLWGGTQNADRLMVRFGNEEALGYQGEFPIACVRICPNAVKFAQQLTHRDYLGALMNLGIVRATMGDIKVGDKQAYLFCKEEMAEYICENLTSVSHTQVTCQVAEYQEVEEEKPKEYTVQVASLRADAVIAKVYNESRGSVQELFSQRRIFQNGRQLEQCDKIVKTGDVIQVRGYGKFWINDALGETKKGKTVLSVSVFGR